jgi:CRISPR/Cas system-associated exonuclease Cas4 (RecB family)
MNPIITQVATALDAYYEKDDAIFDVLDPRYNRSSSVGWLRDCTRYLVLARLHPEARVVTKEQKDRFREGRKQEELMRRDLFESGVKIIGAEKQEDGSITFPPMGKSFVIKDVSLKGEYDDLLEFPLEQTVPMTGEASSTVEVVNDYKSCSAVMFHEVKKYESGPDLTKSTFSWIRHYPDQMQVYLVSQRVPLGMLFFKNKESGERHFVEINWNAGDYHYITDGLAEINEKVKKEDVPPVLEGATVCRQCGFKGFCFPEVEGAVEAGAARQVESEELFAMLVEQDALVKAGVPRAAKRLEELRDEIKDIARTMPGRIRVSSRDGDFLVTMEPGSGKTVYDVPADIKGKYKKIEPNWKPIKIENLGDAL